MTKPHILVTGGLGYIGSHTAVALAQQGWQPVIVDNLSNSHAAIQERLAKLTGQALAVYIGDCQNETLLNSIFEKHPVQAVIHFAGLKAVGESAHIPLTYYDNNINSLLSVLRVMEQYKTKQLIFSSSCTVYGKYAVPPPQETDPFTEAESVYGHTKQICEQIIEQYSRTQPNFIGTCLRYFNPIGAHESAQIGELPLGVPNNLVPLIMQIAAGLRPELLVFGNDYPTPDGTCKRDYIHVSDLADAHCAALKLQNTNTEGYQTYNIGTGLSTSVLEILEASRRITQRNIPMRMVERRPGDIAELYANTSKASKVLGWQAKHTIDQALADAWRWQQSLAN